MEKVNELGWRRAGKKHSNHTKEIAPEPHSPTQKREFYNKDRISLGIACCRLNGLKPEILLVCKRFTYSFNLFVNGRYNSNNNSEIISLFNQMTIDEKHDILSLNFVLIWYRLRSNNITHTVNYFLAKNKFESTFLVDGGNRLKKLISKSTHSEKIWEIPKGRKRNRSELDIHCAVREFYEETGISKKNYKIFPLATRASSFIDDGVKYTNIYFIAFTKYNIKPYIDYSLPEQVEEISDVKWMNIEEIKYIDNYNRLEKFVRPIFHFIKKYAK